MKLIDRLYEKALRLQEKYEQIASKYPLTACWLSYKPKKKEKKQVDP